MINRLARFTQKPTGDTILSKKTTIIRRRYQIHVPVRDAVEKLPSKNDPPSAKYRLESESNESPVRSSQRRLTEIRFADNNVFCHLDTTQYHKNRIPQTLEQIVLSSCTHVLYSSSDTNFDSIANRRYSSRSNGTNGTPVHRRPCFRELFAVFFWFQPLSRL